MAGISRENSGAPRALTLMTYLITFSCYAKRLHGTDQGSVNRTHNAPGTPFVEANRAWVRQAASLLAQPPYTLDASRARVVLDAIRSVCDHRGWVLHAAHVRSSHVHVVVGTDGKPEQAMGSFKAYASRALTAAGFESEGRRRWSRHGSTKYLWNAADVTSAMCYVVECQGAPGALHVGPRVDVR